MDLRGAVFFFGWPKVCLIPSYIPLMLPVSAADYLRAKVKPGLHSSLAACGSEALQVEHVYWDRLCMLTGSPLFNNNWCHLLGVALIPVGSLVQIFLPKMD